MSVEARIPLEDMKYALQSYVSLYNCVHNPLAVYDYKTKIARRTFLSLLLSVIKIVLFSVFISLSSDSGELQAVWIILSIIFGISILLDLVYIQKVSGKRFGKIRLRYPYYIASLINDIRELRWFRKFFGVKTPAFLLMFGIGKSSAHQNIENWGYLVGEDFCNYINAYDEKYRSYREYVDLGQYWGVCDELLEIIQSGRASSIQNALSVMDTRKHRAKMENYAREQAEAARSAAEAAWSEARAMDSVASSMNSVAHSASRSADYLRDIRNSLCDY